MTQILYFLVSKIGGDRQTVLIIDDLDRMDPEHVFRILNVFAAHFDIHETSNKFGFDRIIIVCDIHNIRQIFRSRYGQNTDFSGYIDKFYSRNVFDYNNISSLKKEISTILSSIKYDSKLHRFKINDFSSKEHGFVQYILIALLQINAINLRVFAKNYGRTFSFETKNIGPHNRSYNSHSIPLIPILEILRDFLGDGQTLLEAIDKCVEAEVSKDLLNLGIDGSYNHPLIIILPIFALEQGNIESNIEITYKLPNSNKKIDYFIEETMWLGQYWAKIKQITTENNAHVAINDIFPYLQEALRIIRKWGILQ